MSAAKQPNPTGSLVGLLVAGAIAWFYFGGGLQRQAHRDLRTIQQQVAADAVKQYQLARANGSLADAYVHAQLAAEAFLQAQDEANYRKWKGVQRTEAARAGLPAD